MRSKTLPLAIGLALASVAAQAQQAAQVLPRPPEPFAGRIAPDKAQSTPAWPKQVKAAEGAPNVVVVLLDDVGFAQSSTFGGVAETPALEALAQNGLSYNQFHVAALCSPRICPARPSPLPAALIRTRPGPPPPGPNR